MPFGARTLPDGGVSFRLWAPSTEIVELQLDAGPPLRMRREEGGWHQLTVARATPGTRYKFLVDAPGSVRLSVPDPASRSNPAGVHADSEVIDPRAYAWQTDWQGRCWADAVVYELHIGTFTPAGTFAAARARLADLAALGITAIQIMPLAAFPGQRNWGYDGVLQFAPAACYGAPGELKALIDAAHALKMMVLLDVVYNHFGPDGNYLHAFCPEFFNPAHRTPWGAAINFDGPHSRTVRDFFVHNALFWVEEYRIDGLRMDAVHAMEDTSTPDIVYEIGAALRNGPGRDRPVHVILENNGNDAHYLVRDELRKPICATAQWNDDLHHALHVLVSGETDGYYADYAAAPLHSLGRALTQGFTYQGEYSDFRGRRRGEPSGALPPNAFVGFMQNHDMIGNRAFGDRIHNSAAANVLHAAHVCLLLAPEVPMLFMGEEFSASTPFLYFCDFDGDLAKSVANGRRKEFERFAAFAENAAVARIPDPNAEDTFSASKLKWSERERSPHREQWRRVRELLALRRRFLAPYLSNLTAGGRYEIEGALLRAEWRLTETLRWRLLAHFGAHDAFDAVGAPGEIIYSVGVSEESPRGDAAPRIKLAPGAVLVTMGDLNVDNL